MNDKLEPAAKLRLALSTCGISCMEQSDEEMAATFDRHLNTLLDHVINRKLYTSRPDAKVIEAATLMKAAVRIQSLYDSGDANWNRCVIECVNKVQSLITKNKE